MLRLQMQCCFFGPGGGGGKYRELYMFYIQGLIYLQGRLFLFSSVKSGKPALTILLDLFSTPSGVYFTLIFSSLMIFYTINFLTAPFVQSS